MRRILIALSMTIASCGPNGPPRTEQLVIPVETDSARYELVSKTEVEGLQTVTTERIGKSGSSFAIREVDCSTGKVRYISEGESLEEAMANLRYEDEMRVPFPDSITGEIVSYICS